MSSFVNPALLGGLILLAAPIIIHLLNKRHFQIVHWAAMDFLFQAESKNRRRVRLEDLILLFLRMLIIALIVFAVARPLLRGTGGTREEERIVILDDSFSMEASDGAGTALSIGKESAVSQIEDAVGRSVPVTLWLGTRPGMDAPSYTPPGKQGPAESEAPPAPGEGEEDPKDSRAAAENAADNAAEKAAEEAAGLLAATRETRASDVPFRLAAVFDRLAERLEAKGEAGPRSIVLVSDFRAADWLEPAGGARRTSLRSDLAAGIAELSRRAGLDRIRWRFVDVGSASAENVAVTGVRLSTDHPIAKVPARILVDLHNFGTAERKFVTGELEVGDGGDTRDRGDGAAPDETPPAGAPSKDASPAPAFRPLHRIPLPSLDSVPPGKTVTLEVEFTFEKAGSYPIIARVDGDRLPRDDAAHAVVDIREGLRALVVDGDPGTSRFTSESGFLLSALAPRGPSQGMDGANRGATGILPRRITGEITEKDLEDADLILILNRERISAAEREALEAFARKGGGIGFFLGSKVAPEAYRESFPAGGDPAPQAEISLFPAVLGSAKAADAGRARLRIADDTHPAFGAFRGIVGSSLEQVGFDRFFSIEPRPGARVAARYTDPAATAAIVDAAAGKGRTAIFNLSADRDWNDWPADPSYPIVLQEWARHLARSGSEARSFTAGEPLSWDHEPGVLYTVIPPDGIARPVTAAAARGPSEKGSAPPGSAPASFTDTRAAGFYRVIPRAAEGARVPTAALEPQWHACRRDPAESDLEPAGEARLRGVLLPAGVDFVLGREVEVDVFQKSEEGETWRALACGAAVFLLVELLAAWWFGRR